MAQNLTNICEILCESKNEEGVVNLNRFTDLFKSVFLANKYIDCFGDFDVVSDSKLLKKLLKIPYEKSNLSVIIHNINDTVLLEELNLDIFLNYFKANNYDLHKHEILHWLLFSHFILHNVISSDQIYNFNIKEYIHNSDQLEFKEVLMTYLHLNIILKTLKNKNLMIEYEKTFSFDIFDSQEYINDFIKHMYASMSPDFNLDKLKQLLFSDFHVHMKDLYNVLRENQQYKEYDSYEKIRDLVYSLPLPLPWYKNMEKNEGVPDNKEDDFLKESSMKNELSLPSYMAQLNLSPKVSNPTLQDNTLLTNNSGTDPDDSKSSYLRQNYIWNFEDLRLLINSDLPIFGGGKYPAISLRLRDMNEPGINVLTGIDYWLDNLMCNVPELVMCYHLDGVVQKYEMFKTNEIPELNFIDSNNLNNNNDETITNNKNNENTSPQETCSKRHKFDPNLIRDLARNLLSFIKSKCTKQGHTYWLFKGPDDEIVKLYDLTSLLRLFNCSMRTPATVNTIPDFIFPGTPLYNKDLLIPTPANVALESFQRQFRPADLLYDQSKKISPNIDIPIENPYSFPVALLLFKLAFNIKNNLQSKTNNHNNSDNSLKSKGGIASDDDYNNISSCESLLIKSRQLLLDNLIKAAVSTTSTNIRGTPTAAAASDDTSLEATNLVASDPGTIPSKKLRKRAQKYRLKLMNDFERLLQQQHQTPSGGNLADNHNLDSSQVNTSGIDKDQLNFLLSISPNVAKLFVAVSYLLIDIKLPQSSCTRDPYVTIHSFAPERILVPSSSSMKNEESSAVRGNSCEVGSRGTFLLSNMNNNNNNSNSNGGAQLTTGNLDHSASITLNKLITARRRPIYGTDKKPLITTDEDVIVDDFQSKRIEDDLSNQNVIPSAPTTKRTTTKSRKKKLLSSKKNDEKIGSQKKENIDQNGLPTQNISSGSHDDKTGNKESLMTMCQVVFELVLECFSCLDSVAKSNEKFSFDKSILVTKGNLLDKMIYIGSMLAIVALNNELYEESSSFINFIEEIQACLTSVINCAVDNGYCNLFPLDPQSTLVSLCEMKADYYMKSLQNSNSTGLPHQTIGLLGNNYKEKLVKHLSRFTTNLPYLSEQCKTFEMDFKKFSGLTCPRQSNSNPPNPGLITNLTDSLETYQRALNICHELEISEETEKRIQLKLANCFNEIGNCKFKECVKLFEDINLIVEPLSSGDIIDRNEESELLTKEESLRLKNLLKLLRDTCLSAETFYLKANTEFQVLYDEEDIRYGENQALDLLTNLTLTTINKARLPVLTCETFRIGEIYLRESGKKNSKSDLVIKPSTTNKIITATANFYTPKLVTTFYPKALFNLQKVVPIIDDFSRKVHRKSKNASNSLTPDMRAECIKRINVLRDCVEKQIVSLHIGCAKKCMNPLLPEEELALGYSTITVSPQNVDFAIEILEKGLDKYPLDPTLNYHLGSAYFTRMILLKNTQLSRGISGSNSIPDKTSNSNVKLPLYLANFYIDKSIEHYLNLVTETDPKSIMVNLDKALNIETERLLYLTQLAVNINIKDLNLENISIEKTDDISLKHMKSIIFILTNSVLPITQKIQYYFNKYSTYMDINTLVLWENYVNICKITKLIFNCLTTITNDGQNDFQKIDFCYLKKDKDQKLLFSFGQDIIKLLNHLEQA